MLSALAENFPAVLLAIKLSLYAAGLFLVVIGLYYWGSGGGGSRGQHSHGSGVIVSLVIGGSLLLSLPALITLSGASIGLGSDPRLVLSSVPVNRTDPLSMVAMVCFNLASVIGYTSAGWGVYSFAMSGSRKEDGFWVGVRRLFAGAVLVNLQGAMALVARSVGGTQMASYIDNLI